VLVSRAAPGVQAYKPVLGMPVPIVETGRMFEAGPRSRTKEMVLDVVACQVIVKGLQAGTIWC
jgi:hypothetical protein